MIPVGKTLITLLLLAGRALAVSPDAGPMVGHVTDNSARLWMQFPVAGEVTVNTFDVSHPSPVSSVRVGLEGPSPFVCDIPINGLQPNKVYRVELKFDGEPVKVTGPDVVIRTAPSPGDESVFSIAFAGGIHAAPMVGAVAGRETHRMPAFSAITNLKPRAFLFLGGTGMLPEKIEDFPTTHRAAYRFIADFHSALRREPDLVELTRGTPCYGIFGERDFGPAGADGNYIFAQESLVAFQRFWPNPDWGTPENPGCFSTFTIGDVDFYLLDARTFRQATAPDAKMLGDAQLAWLKKNLKASKASFKILATSCPLWGPAADPKAADSWASFPAEQQDFLKWLADNRIDGIIGLAGGQSFAQLRKVDAGKYPLFSLESGALLAGPGAAEPAPDPTRIGYPVPGESFGTLDFSGQREHRFVTLRLRDVTGKTKIEQTLLVENLRH